MTSFLVLVGIGVVACLLVEAFFSGSEMAMVNADRIKLRSLADAGNTGAARALALLAHEDKLLGTCLIGTNLSTVTGATLVATSIGALDLQLGAAAGLAYVPFTLIFGEALPKSIFQHHADRLAPAIATPLRFAQVVFSPGILIVSAWSRALDRVVGQGNDAPVSREEIVDLLDEAGGGGAIADEDRRLIQRVFEISETPVDEVMTPLVHVEAIADDATIAEASALAIETGHSRLPVYRERIDNLIGVVHVSKLLFATAPDGPLAPLIEPVSYVPTVKRVDHLLAEMRQRREQIAVIVDEYGGSVGIATIEDLLEEIVGEIHDERDEAEPAIQQVGEREWRVPAGAEIEEVADAIGFPLPEGDYETIAGCVLASLGRIPKQGDTAQVGELTIVVEEATERAIVTVRILLPPPPG